MPAFTGALVGFVSDSEGIPQLGATVQLFDRFGRQVAHSYTATDGRFAFPNLRADTYSVRVSLSDFLPARKVGIPIQAGTASMLQVHLATLLSSIEFRYTVPTSAMSRDWKWVLRSSPATRPITRLRGESAGPGQDSGSSDSEAVERAPRVFSDVHAVVSVSGGDGAVVDADSPQGDFGTGFALSTNLFGKNQLLLRGDVAQNSALAPAAMAFTAVYNRTKGPVGGSAAPEVTFTVSQIGIAGGSAAAADTQGQTAAVPLVRSMALSIYQALSLGGTVRLEYGAAGESVAYLQTTSRVSPFARIAVPAGHSGQFLIAYSDGARPDELRAHQADADSDGAEGVQPLPANADCFARLPQLSYGNGRLQLQRTLTYEAGYSKTLGKSSVAISAFSDSAVNGRIDASGDTSILNPGNLMSDGVSNVSVYNFGRFRRKGVVGSVSRNLSNSISVAAAYGQMGGLDANAGTVSTDGYLGDFLSARMHNAGNAAINVRTAKAHTRISANYGWMDKNAVVPRHIFTTQSTDISPGLNLLVQQPLPSFLGMPGHLVVSADLRNLLAQGYMPVDPGSEQKLMLVQTPRAVLGGLNFVF